MKTYFVVHTMNAFLAPSKYWDDLYHLTTSFEEATKFKTLQSAEKARNTYKGYNWSFRNYKIDILEIKEIEE